MAVLVFDLTNPHPFDNLTHWLGELKENCAHQIRIVVVGNKSDLTDKRAIKREDAEAMARKLDAPYFETSAKTGSRVSTVFESAAGQLMNDLALKKLAPDVKYGSTRQAE